MIDYDILPGLPGGPPYQKAVTVEQIVEAARLRFLDMTIGSYADAVAYIKWFRV